MGNNLNPGGFPPPGGKKGDNKKGKEPFKKREAPPQRVGRKKKKKGVDAITKLPTGNLPSLFNIWQIFEKLPQMPNVAWDC